MPQSNVYRRRQILRLRNKGERSIQAAIQPLLGARFKSLSRELRQGNLKKRLRKFDGDFAKAAPADNWKKWQALFNQTLENSITDGGVLVWQVEQNYFQSYGYQPLRVEPAEVLQAYDARDRTRITNISAETETHVNQVIADWYNTEAGLPELIEMLEQFFSPYRAELIATTEMAYVASRVALNMMAEYDIGYWQWDAFEDAITCFPAMTKIATPKGQRNIESLSVMDEVLTPQGKQRIRHVSKRKYDGVLVFVRAGQYSFWCTAEHPVWCNRSWVKAAQINPGDVLNSFNNQQVEVDTIIYLTLSNPDGLPAVAREIGIPSSVFFKVPVPISAIGFKCNPEIWQGEVNRVAPDLHLGNKNNTDIGKACFDLLLDPGLPVRSPITGKGTKTGLCCLRGSSTKFFSALLAFDNDRRSSAFLRTMMSSLVSGNENLSAPFAHGFKLLERIGAPTTFQRTDSVSISIRNKHIENIAANWAKFLGVLSGNPLLSAFRATDILMKEFAFDMPVGFSANFANQPNPTRGVVASLGAEVGSSGINARGEEIFSAILANIVRHDNNSVSIINDIAHKTNPIVYNIEVEDEHVFYANGLLVHNCDLCFDLMAQSKITPFRRGDPMPPDPSHPKCRCGCYFLGVDVKVK